MKKFGKISRFIISFVISFSLFYSSYEISNSLAENASSSYGQFKLKSSAKLNVCSVPSDAEAPNFAPYFNIPNDMKPLDPWREVTPKILSGDNELKKRTDVPYRIWANCHIDDDGITKLEYAAGDSNCDENNKSECQSLDAENFTRKHLDNAVFGNNDTYDNLMAYFECNTEAKFVKNPYSNTGSCSNSDKLSCEIKISEPSTYAKDYKIYSNNNIGNKESEKLIKEKIASESNGVNGFYGLFFEGSNMLGSGNIWPFDSSIPKRISARDAPYSYNKDGSENLDGNGYFSVRCKYDTVNQKSFITVESSSASCPANHYSYAKAVFEYDIKSNSFDKKDDGAILKSFSQVEDRLNSAASVGSESNSTKKNVVFVQSSSCNPVQCLIKARGKSFYVDPTPNDLKMFTRKAVAKEYYVKDVACAKWELRDKHIWEDKKSCWEEIEEKEELVERRKERREERCSAGDYVANFFDPFGWFGTKKCFWEWVTESWYVTVRWLEKTLHCSWQTVRTTLTNEVCVGYDYKPLPGDFNNLFNDTWDCKTSEGKVPFVHYNYDDLIATLQKATEGSGVAAPNRNLNSFYDPIGMILKDKGKCDYLKWSSDNCPEPTVGEEGKSQCFTRKKGAENNNLLYERKWCSDDGKRGWINYHCDSSGRATIYSQKTVIESGDAHPEIDFIGELLNDQKFYTEAHSLHANNFTNLKNKSVDAGRAEGDIYHAWNLFRNYGTGCCNESNPEDCVRGVDVGEGFQDFWNSLDEETIGIIVGGIIAALGVAGATAFEVFEVITKLISGGMMGICGFISVAGLALITLCSVLLYSTAGGSAPVTIPLIIFGAAMVLAGNSCVALSAIVGFASGIVKTVGAALGVSATVIGGLVASISGIIKSIEAEMSEKGPGYIDDGDVDYTKIE
ncbi:hypothetical protein N9C35_03775 [Flavobacteriaceae bacterium]|nr:hypothetical protein [Flavobacteriaceae bacterium]